jgi:phosphoglycolate phosphatase-like HAD superfamily hydrolase
MGLRPAAPAVYAPRVVRLVLFDVDGTLIHTGGAGVKAFARTLAAEFGQPNGTEGIKFGGRTDPSLVREAFGNCGIPASPENFERFFSAYVFWLDHLLGNNANGGACPGVWQLLDGLRALPQPPLLGLLTGNIRLGAEIKLRRYGLWEVFPTGAFGDDDEDRDRIAMIAKTRGSRLLGTELDGDQIVVVGDTPRDIACGRAIGAKVLAVATGGAALEYLKAHRPDWVVEDLQRVGAAEVCR